MADVQIHFLDPLNEFYGKPVYAAGHARQLAALAADLTDDQLQAAARRVIEHHNKPPVLKALQKALQGVALVAHAPLSTEPQPWDIQARDRAEAQARRAACALCRCPLGRTADKQGWLVALIGFATAQGRLPVSTEIPALVAQARASERGLDAARGSEMHARLVELRILMLEKASRDVFGDEAIRRDFEPRPEPVTGRDVRASGGHAVRQQALARLEELRREAEAPALSPQALAACGVPPRPQRTWTTEEPVGNGP